MIYYIDDAGSIVGHSSAIMPDHFYVGCQRVEHSKLPEGSWVYQDGGFTASPAEEPAVLAVPTTLTAVEYKGWLGVDRYVEIMHLKATDPKVSYYADLMNESFAAPGYIEASHPLTLEGLEYLQSLPTEHLATVLDDFKAKFGLLEAAEA